MSNFSLIQIKFSEQEVKEIAAKSKNRKENLELLCPNCHSQTETWGSKRGFKGH